MDVADAIAPSERSSARTMGVVIAVAGQKVPGGLGMGVAGSRAG